jgi:tetratricopeptide (TPR) repeat protein
MSVTFKIVFAQNNIRRLKFSVFPSYEEFVSLLKSTYPSYFYDEKKFQIKYVDCDNDKIAVSTQLEWEELVSQLSGNKILKIFIEEKSEECEEPKKDEKIKIEESVPTDNDFIKDLFEVFGNVVRDIPQMTENFWQQCVDWEEKNNVFWNLHQFSMESLDSLDKNVVQKGKEAILQMLEIIPDHAIALYNLACAESILGNAKEALDTLEKAVEAGYHDLTHMINDTDFDNIKNTMGFNELVAKLQRIISPKPPQSTLDQEPVVIDFTKDDKTNEAKSEEKRDPEEEMLDTLAEIFPLPRDILRELLTECKGNAQGVVDLISSTYN